MPLTERMKYVRWFLAHVNELRPLLDLPQQLRSATSIVEKWTLLKSTGDQIVELIESFPADDAPLALSQHSLQAESVAQGIPWDQLMDLLPVLIRLIQLIQGEKA